MDLSQTIGNGSFEQDQMHKRKKRSKLSYPRCRKAAAGLISIQAQASAIRVAHNQLFADLQ
jgi:hypothetical protein